jgi:hypothetical protein
LVFEEGEEMNSKRLISIFVFFVILTLFPSSVFAQELRETPPVGMKILDLIVVRPISASVACVSTAFCAGTMPLAYVIGVGEQSARVLIEAPWRFTGGRYLGDFYHYKDGKPITVVQE